MRNGVSRLGLVLIGVALLVGLLELSDAVRARSSRDVVTVTGSAKRPIVSDYIVWNVTVSSQQPTPQAAARELGGWTRRVRDFLREEGARDAEVRVAPIFTETITGQGGEGEPSGTIVGYRLTRTLEVRSGRVSEIAALVERSSRLLAEGIPLAAQTPQYIFTGLAGLRPQLLAAATRDALARAKVLVEATGSTLGKVREVRVGVFQITPVGSTEVSDYGVYDTSTVEKEVTAVVNVTFALR